MPALHQRLQLLNFPLRTNQSNANSGGDVFCLHSNVLQKQIYTQMNIIYHRNCLDGSYSSYVMEIIGRTVSEEEMDGFIEKMVKLREGGVQNLKEEVEKDVEEGDSWKGGRCEINQNFFHSSRGMTTCAYSFFAGEFYPLEFPNKKKVLFIVDTNLVSAQNISVMCKSHELVVLIDHHTSFLDVQKDLCNLQLKNFIYLFDQRRCASQLALLLATRYFDLSARLSLPYLQKLSQEITYVAANDLKTNESRESKAFVLGWYYFEVEMSHGNPNLYKRIGLLNLEYLLGKGKNLYRNHLEEIQTEVSYAKVCQFLTGGLKNKKCFYVEPRNANKISDIGTILAFLSAEEGLLNLAVLAMKKQYEVRVSCRSSKHKSDPMALTLAKSYGGGGHTEAAGFKMTSNQLKTQFKILSAASVSTSFKLQISRIQQIFFNSPLEKSL